MANPVVNWPYDWQRLTALNWQEIVTAYTSLWRDGHKPLETSFIDMGQTKIVTIMYKPFYRLSLILGIVALIYSHSALAQMPIDLSDYQMHRLDQGQLSYYRDPGAEITLNDILTPGLQKQFQPLLGNLGLGYNSDAAWLKFTLHRTSEQPADWWLEVQPSYLDNLQLAHLTPTGQIETYVSGDFFPLSAKQLPYRNAVFKLHLTPGTHTFYLRIKTTSILAALVKLWPPNDFKLHARNSYFLLGLYFGFLIMVIVFNFVYNLVTKRKTFLYYSIYLLTSGFYWFTSMGLINEFIFPEYPLYAHLSVGISMVMSASLALIFYSQIFELHRYHPRLYKLYYLGICLGIITAISTPFGYYQKGAPWVLIIIIICIFFTFSGPLVRLWRTKEIPNRIIVVTYILFTLMISSNILKALGLLPFDDSLMYTGMLSGLSHALLLYLAITLQYRNIEKINQQLTLDSQIALIEKQQAEIARQEQSDFLAMMAHEIRTPIAIIDAANESLRLLHEQDDEDQEAKPRRFERITRAVRRLNTVLEMVLTNTEHESWPFSKTQINLAELTYEVIELLGRDAVQRIKLNGATSLSIDADRRMLRIALLNILDNALKYAPASSEIHIETGYAVRHGINGVYWQVLDQGPGIPDGMHTKIFAKYQRGSEQSGEPGLGLGLYLVQHVIERHKGELIAENHSRGGAKMGFWLVK